LATLTCVALSTLIAVAIAPTSALIVQVRGNPETVSIEVQNVSVAEIFETLSNAFDARHRSSTNLDKRLTGAYKGSLQKVVTQVLKGCYDFVVGTSERKITLIGSSAGSRNEEPGPAAGGRRGAQVPC